ncbi:MAG TPA: hypothetical protein VJT73_15295 [Polyangiaceae bacterium]|nr:hypothetical protein [Polyangiaceae bacterium]
MKLRLTTAAIALGLTFSTVSLAQDQVWLKDRRYGEGIGVRAGDLEIHPGVAGEFGYDSNYFLRSDSGGPPPASSLRLRITPSLSLSTLSQQRRDAEGGTTEPPKVSFRAGAAATYNEFIATKSQQQDEFSKQRNIGGLANLQLTILPGRPLSVDLYGDFLRSVQPSKIAEFNFDRLNARFGGGFIWAPGGGMFDWRVGYEYGLTYFEDAQFRNLSNAYNQVNTRGRWRFLPRTAFLFDANAGFIRYNQGPTLQLPSDPVRARIGLNGLVSPSFALLAMVGWGASFYKGVAAQQFDSVIGQAEFKWFITPNPGLDPSAATLALSSVSVGFSRDFFNSYLGNFYARDRGYLNVSYFFGGRFLLVADGGVAAFEYPDLIASGTFVPAFTTLRIDSTLFGEYRVADSFGLNATLRYTANLTDQVVNGDPLDWKRFEGFVGARWFL